MGKTTGISWTDSTWNPWMGCHKVSTGCKNCYMFREQEHYGNDPNVVRRSKTTFNDPLKWKEPKRIFVCSWSDFFIKEADEWRVEAWDIIRKTPHIYQIPTKRPENIINSIPGYWDEIRERIILLVSTENQETYNRRTHYFYTLSMYGASHRVKMGISAEPLLENIDLGATKYILNWVIVGGESGAKNKVRIDNLDWYRSLRDQCQEAGIPFFLKQAWIDGQLVKEPFLDGRQWLEFPDSF